jgi:hypothetical protein
MEIIIKNWHKPVIYKTKGNPELKDDKIIFRNLILQFRNHGIARKIYKRLLFNNVKNLSVKGVNRILRKSSLQHHIIGDSF